MNKLWHDVTCMLWTIMYHPNPKEIWCMNAFLFKQNLYTNWKLNTKMNGRNGFFKRLHDPRLRAGSVRMPRKQLVCFIFFFLENMMLILRKWKEKKKRLLVERLIQTFKISDVPHTSSQGPIVSRRKCGWPF